MPITRSAIKKQRQDRKKSKINLSVKKQVGKIVNEYKKKPTLSLYNKLVSTLDKAAKKNIMHSNKANRLKSRFSKLLHKTSKEKIPSVSTKLLKKTSPPKKKSVV